MVSQTIPSNGVPGKGNFPVVFEAPVTFLTGFSHFILLREVVDGWCDAYTVRGVKPNGEYSKILVGKTVNTNHYFTWCGTSTGIVIQRNFNWGSQIDGPWMDYVWLAGKIDCFTQNL
jgi:hypothetical protein